jgi:hypothetical protein
MDMNLAAKDEMKVIARLVLREEDGSLRTDTLRAMVGNPCVFIVTEAIELSDSAQSSNDVAGPGRLRRRDREDAIASRRNHRLIDIAAGDHGRYSRLVDPPLLEPGIVATIRAD